MLILQCIKKARTSTRASSRTHSMQALANSNIFLLYYMSETKKIMVVDDEDTICEVIKLNLELEGYEVDTANSAEEVLTRTLTDYRLFILDVMMGEMSGFELASHIRADAQVGNVPIIICTAKDREDDLVEGFARGIDDYIRKPFSMRELVLRVKSVLRRSEHSTGSDPVMRCGDLVVDAQRKQCHIAGNEIQLTKKEFEILRLLLANRGKIFSREEILDSVWEDDVLVIDRTIDVNINRLRKKIGVYGNEIITKQGYGYGFKE